MHAPQRDSILWSVVVGFVSLGVMAEVMHSRAASDSPRWVSALGAVCVARGA